MTEAGSVHSTPQTSSSADFAALSAAVHPAWHEAILRLAIATEMVASQLELWKASHNETGAFVRKTRDLAQGLIDFLDQIDGDPDFEGELLDDDSEELEQDDPAEDDGTGEPSLGSLERHPSMYSPGRDRVGDQTEWAAGDRTEREQSDGDDEPDVDSEPSLGWNDEGELGETNDKETGDDFEGRIAYLDQRRAARRRAWSGPHDAA